MATYKGIQGFTIQNLSADPSNPIEGQVWYNSTSNVWKVEEATAAGAWATGGSLGTGRYTRMIGGTQNDAILAGGLVPAPAITEEYNGTSWSAGGAMNVIRRANTGCGVTTAAVNVGGTTLPNGTPPIGGVPFGSVVPPTFTAAVVTPQPVFARLITFIAPPADQEVPLYSSVIAGAGTSPPAKIASF
jgi:hypothetical protein